MGTVPPRTFVLAGSRGPLCAVYFAPRQGVAPIGDVLVVPPFSEEMNRCRAMVAMQARALAEQGAGTLIIDPFGTGDSAGEFVDASWATWRADLLLGIEWLNAHGQGCRALLGVRLGAIMASELLVQQPRIQHLMLWQPVLNGKTFYTQFLRIRIAAEMNRADGIKSTSALRQMSAAGTSIEVSGYEIGAVLAQELDALVFNEETLKSPLQTDWFEVNTDAATPLSAASLKAVEKLQAAGASVQTHAVAGPAFWHVHERELAPDLIQATASRVAAWDASPAARGQVAMQADAALQAQCEYPMIVECGAEHLSGFMHKSAKPSQRGVVIVVAGGPQYRAGAHRQFVSMARKLAGLGCPVLRFDLRGMGDSSGPYLGFEHSEADICAAVDALVKQEPQLREVVLIGECESASGILFYGWKDPRVAGAVLINPWVRTEEGQAQVIINHYYWDRLRSAEFWSQLWRGKFKARESLASLVRVLRAYVRGKRDFARASLGSAQDDISGLPLPVKTAAGLSRFKGQVLLLMSGHDYIAREFDEVTSASKAWAGLLDSPRLVRTDVEGADHTFSTNVWKNAASDSIVQWMERW